MSAWADAAQKAIAAVHASLSATASLEERRQAIDAAYPFGVRAYSPYKTWLRARRAYLCRFGYQPRGASRRESPMERMMRRGAGQ